MPKTTKVGITRKINLGRYGLPYETIDISVEGCDSFEEAEKIINDERNKIHQAFIPEALKRLDQLSNKAQLTFTEEKEREELGKIINLNSLPF